MSNALYPGSFDPVTLGHLDIIERASRQFDQLFIGVIHNINKHNFFTLPERIALMKEATQHLENITVVSFEGLSVACAKKYSANILIRGLRAISDFEYELQIASTNKQIAPEVETFFLMSKTEYSYVSSSLVKELAFYQADVNMYVPPCVSTAIVAKQGEKSDV